MPASSPAVLPYRGATPPRLPQRGATEIFRSASITTTSMAARLCSFSKLTSVTTDRDVPRWDPIESEGQDVLPAELAATEGREMETQGVVGSDDVLFHQILDHSNASAGRTTDPVKVDPVVPVSRTV